MTFEQVAHRIAEEAVKKLRLSFPEILKMSASQQKLVRETIQVTAETMLNDQHPAKQ